MEWNNVISDNFRVRLVYEDVRYGTHLCRDARSKVMEAYVKFFPSVVDSKFHCSYTHTHTHILFSNSQFS